MVWDYGTSCMSSSDKPLVPLHKFVEGFDSARYTPNDRMAGKCNISAESSPTLSFQFASLTTGATTYFIICN